LRRSAVVDGARLVRTVRWPARLSRERFKAGCLGAEETTA
jgi:hypothetical protein